MPKLRNVQAMTDFELNLEIARLLPPIVNDKQPSETDAVKTSFVMVNDIVSEWQFDPVNNWSDLMPLIDEYGISFQHKHTNGLTYVAMSEYIDDGKAFICKSGTKPKRALAECLLQVLNFVKSRGNESE